MKNSRSEHAFYYVLPMKFVTVVTTVVLVLFVRTTGALRPQGVIPISQPTPTPTPFDTSGFVPVTEPPSTDTPTPTTTPTPTPTPKKTKKPASSGGTVVKTYSPTPTPTTTPTPKPSPSPTPHYTYRDGTYSADGTFDTPAGIETIGITLVISKDKVVDTSAVDKASNPTSQSYTNDFINNFRSYVIGKSLSSLSLGKISSASLTPNGFNNAAASIRSQAK